MSQEYRRRLEGIVRIKREHEAFRDTALEMLETSEAVIFDGHFELLSEKHSETFFRFAAITQYPYYVAQISKEMVRWLREVSGIGAIDVVLSPSSQGMFFAYDIARELNGECGARAVYSVVDEETGRPVKECVKGFDIRRGERVLIVNDITSTGRGLKTLIELAEEAGASVSGICVFANRGPEEALVEEIGRTYLLHNIVELDMPAWDKGACDLCSTDRKLIYSKDINGLPIFSGRDAYSKYVKALKRAA